MQVKYGLMDKDADVRRPLILLYRFILNGIIIDQQYTGLLYLSTNALFFQWLSLV